MEALERMERCVLGDDENPLSAIENLRKEFGCVSLHHRDILKAVVDEIKDELEERYMALPLGADGKPIRVGDMVVDYPAPSEVVAVSEDGIVLGGYRGDHTTCGVVYAGDYRHYRKQTVEDVLEDALSKAAMLDRSAGYRLSAADIIEIVNEIAPKLQLRSETEEEGQAVCDCNAGGDVHTWRR